MKKQLILLFFLGFLGTSIQAQQKVLEPLKVSQIRGINVFGKPVDNQTRCVHWHSDLDIIAIKFKCCEKYYPCYSCHEEEAEHEPKVWPREEFDQKAILCGVCGTELSIADYMASNNTCPKCQSAFNPGCSKHYHLYFETK
ncbi:CHY zinc finger protein [Algoriphagus vanfongensis]|uniref:CHY zinc finger protein n=1 Tax=Algoriphagus vanfongensis TaxID=426371 RepID=UPI00040AB42E|nr:CHY zinc finger protein [Algoriphagus vanfongensis]